MSNPPNEIDRALAAAGLPPLDELAEEYSLRCFEQFAPLVVAGMPFPILAAVALQAFGGLTASLLLTLECAFPGEADANAEAGVEAFAADLRAAVRRGPKTMEEVERWETEMEAEMRENS